MADRAAAQDVGDSVSEKRSTHLIAAAILGALLSVAATVAGLLYDNSRLTLLSADLARRGDSLLYAVSELTIAARAESDALALRHRLGLDLTSALPEGLPIAASLLAFDQGKRTLTTKSIIRNVDGALHNQPGKVFELSDAFSISKKAPYLYPPAQPTHIVYCAQSIDGLVACSSVSLDLITKRLQRLSGDLVSYAIRRQSGEEVAASSDWALSNVDYGEYIATNSSVPLELWVRPNQELIERSGIWSGLRSAAFSYLVFGLGFWVYAQGSMRRHEQSAFAAALQRERDTQRQFLVSSIASVASSTGVRFYLARPDGMVDLFGPWDDEVGIEEGSITPPQLFSTVIGGDELLGKFVEAVRTRSSWSSVLTRRIDGEESVHQSSAAPLHTKAGEFIGLLGVSTNVSKAIEAENTLAQSRAHNEIQTIYMRHLAHEMKRPIMRAQSAMKLLSESLEHQDKDTSQRWVDVVEKSLTSLNEVVASSLDLMRMRQAALTEKLTPVNMEAAVKTVSGLLEAAASSRAQRFSIKVLQGTGVALTNETAMRRVLWTFMHNALVYSPEGSVVHVFIESNKGRCLVNIEDEGPGVLSEELHRIGKPFFRGTHATNSGTKGNGLGVALALEYARIAGAKVGIERSTKPGRGLLVCIRCDVPSDDADVTGNSNQS